MSILLGMPFGDLCRVRGASKLAFDYEAYRANRNAVNATMRETTGTSPAVSLSGTGVFGFGQLPGAPFSLTIEITTGGSSAGVFKYSLDGSNYTTGVSFTSGTPVAIGATGLSATFASGTYVIGAVYQMTLGAIQSIVRKGFGTAFAPSSAATSPIFSFSGGPTKRPQALIFNSATTDSVNNSSSSFASGAPTAFAVALVFKIDALPGATRSIWRIVGAGTSAFIDLGLNSTPAFFVRKKDDSGTTITRTVSSGAAPETSSWHLALVNCLGSTVELWIDGSQLTLSSSAFTGTTTMTQMLIGNTAGGAISMRFGRIAGWSNSLDAGERVAITKTIRNKYGI